jgi:hypothetical protein
VKIDTRKTKAAVVAHKAGVKMLDKLFAATPARLSASGLQHGNAKPVRLHPGTPPVRDAEHKARRRRRKIANESRRRNR